MAGKWGPIVALGVLIAQSSATAPFMLTWAAGQSFGPDGPWQAVQVSIGTPLQPIALYPGGTFLSHLLTSKICSNSTLTPFTCFASTAGVYTVSESLTAIDGTIAFPATADFTHGGLEVQGSAGIGILDQVNIGVSTSVPNVTLAPNDDVNLVYPGGSTPPLEVGNLALGYLGTVNQTFQDKNTAVEGALIPGYLQSIGTTASNTFGLHIGSANLQDLGFSVLRWLRSRPCCGKHHNPTGTHSRYRGTG